jgi:hypothetical protein
MEYSRNDWVELALYSIVNPEETSDDRLQAWYQTDLGQFHLNMLYYVAGSFYRSEVDSKSKFGKMPPCRSDDMKRHKLFVEACGELWVSTFNLLGSMQQIGRWIGTYSHIEQATSSIWMRDLISDGEFLTPWLWYQDPSGIRGVSELIARLQRENAALSDPGTPFENPFFKHNTRVFVDSARTQAARADRFRQKYYNPMIRRRKAIATLLIEHPFVAIDIGGKPITAGRKPKPHSSKQS